MRLLFSKKHWQPLLHPSVEADLHAYLDSIKKAAIKIAAFKIQYFDQFQCLATKIVKSNIFFRNSEFIQHIHHRG